MRCKKFSDVSPGASAISSGSSSSVRVDCKSTRSCLLMAAIESNDGAPLEFILGQYILGLVMGGHHASYRADPGRPLVLLPALRSALCGDVFAAFGQRAQQHRKMCGLRTNDGYAGFNRRSQLQA